MRNNLLIVWNLLLTATVAFLFFYAFNLKSQTNSKEMAAAPKAAAASDTASQLRIAYVNIDSLEKNYKLFAQKKKELEGKQQQSEAILNKKIATFQTDYSAAQQQAATMTQSQLQSVQDKLQKEQADIQQLQSTLQSDFQNQLDKFNVQLKDSLDSFLKTYNADKKYTYVLSFSQGSDILFAQPQFDITAEAVKGMNLRMQQ